MSTDTTTKSDEEARVDAYEAQRAFKFRGRAFSPGEHVTVEVFSHPRFETLIRTGYIREVRA